MGDRQKTIDLENQREKQTREVKQPKLEQDEEEKDTELVVRRVWKASKGGMVEEVVEEKKKLRDMMKRHKLWVQEDVIIPTTTRPRRIRLDDLLKTLLRKQVSEEEITSVEADPPSAFSTVVLFRRLEREAYMSSEYMPTDNSAPTSAPRKAYASVHPSTYERMLRGKAKVVVAGSSLHP